jgi:hypothetical protein
VAADHFSEAARYWRRQLKQTSQWPVFLHVDTVPPQTPQDAPSVLLTALDGHDTFRFINQVWPEFNRKDWMLETFGTETLGMARYEAPRFRLTNPLKWLTEVWAVRQARRQLDHALRITVPFSVCELPGQHMKTALADYLERQSWQGNPRKFYTVRKKSP